MRINRRRIGIVLLAALAPASRAATDPDWILTFRDEFNGSDIDFLHWTPHDPSGEERNRELQAYMPANVQFGGGSAHLIARREKATYDGHLRIFTSGTMTTVGLFAQTYGRFVIRCRAAEGSGFESSFSLLPVPNGELPAITLVDIRGADASLAHFANRWGDPMTERSYDGSYAIGKTSDGFHEFAIEWDAQKIAWFIDGRERFRSVEGIPHQPMYLALRLAVGGSGAGRVDETTPFPASFDVDYIRLYKHK